MQMVKAKKEYTLALLEAIVQRIMSVLTYFVFEIKQLGPGTTLYMLQDDF